MNTTVIKYTLKILYCLPIKEEDAEGSIAMIPYLSPKKAKYLKTFDQKSKGDEINIEDLTNYVKLNIEAKDSDKARIKKIIRYDNKLESSSYLEAKKTK
ncbi:hypothetical protein C1645_823165 [Glomus cerebriforme]|uniref:Uncharacterized protein n=1 Tax=Glomus cerebriforme TaxID=658196 RepID=A0A397T173_9GLOM|nr:hypothetical protein C1645_823165 [Glomus cerebriforme]